MRENPKEDNEAGAWSSLGFTHRQKISIPKCLGIEKDSGTHASSTSSLCCSPAIAMQQNTFLFFAFLFFFFKACCANNPRAFQSFVSLRFPASSLLWTTFSPGSAFFLNLKSLLGPCFLGLMGQSKPLFWDTEICKPWQHQIKPVTCWSQYSACFWAWIIWTLLGLTTKRKVIWMSFR